MCISLAETICHHVGEEFTDSEVGNGQDGCGRVVASLAIQWGDVVEKDVCQEDLGEVDAEVGFEVGDVQMLIGTLLEVTDGTGVVYQKVPLSVATVGTLAHGIVHGLEGVGGLPLRRHSDPVVRHHQSRLLHWSCHSRGLRQ